ncbi:hypothetical protein [uncultured Polaribacter sp.]|uniref:hypothetical protein n=1 Tax=uncultured Polaribacter sp. TaxID=174711 RepID=UPI0026265E9F|nr:hypothetical protein [uncultured Polaribacter sp.]
MKTINYSLFVLFLTFLCTSCFENEYETYVSNIENEFTAFNVDNNYKFTSDEANLVIEAGNYSDIQVTLADETTNPSVSIDRDVISLIKIDDFNYTISSPEAGEQLIIITVVDASGNEFIGYRRMFFYEHGTTDFNTVEGVQLNFDFNKKLIALHGEPELLEEYQVTITSESIDDAGNTVTETRIEDRERWYYFSKGFVFNYNPLTEHFYTITLYGENWLRNIDDVNYNGEIYPYQIDGLSSFNSATGLLMDEVVEKYGEPIYKSDGTTLQLYQYDNATFTFLSDNADDYLGKKVLNITIF